MVERDLAVMRKLEVPPQETAFILITSDKDSLTANREWKEIDALKLGWMLLEISRDEHVQAWNGTWKQSVSRCFHDLLL